MKRVVWILCVLFLMRLTLHAQDKSSFKDNFYAKAGGGFGIGLCYYDPCDYYNEDYYPTYDNTKSINFVPGRGGNVDLGAGYMFTKNIGAELDFKEFFGIPVKETLNDYYNESNPRTQSYSLNGMMFQIIPSIVFDLDLATIDPYTRFGMIIGAAPEIKLKETDVSNHNTYYYEGKYVGNVPLGYSAAIGVKYKFTDNLSIFGELECNGINYTPKKYLLTKYTVNGVNEFSSLTTKDKETDFVKSYDASQSIPAGSPQKQLKQTYPFSNFEINIGVMYRF